MKHRALTLNTMLVVSLFACSSSKTPTPQAVDAAVLPDVAPVSASDLTQRAAGSICGALYRCCDDDLETYFAPFRGNDLLEEFRDRLPPAAPLDEEQCKVVVAQMLDIVPLGDWVRAASDGAVTYNPDAAASCLAALDGAACGQPARDALWDSTCFGFAAPSGGTEQRRYFSRTRGVDQACTPIRDGIGAAFFGTCDPTTTFCCYEEPGRTGCQYPFDAANHPRAGTCMAVAPVGQACSATLPVKLCATGVDCDSETLTCVQPSQMPLSVGQPCIDSGYHALGECQGSFCDIFGTKRCEPLRADGQACMGGDECQSGRCQSVCVPMDLCTGTLPPPPPPTDAGIDAMIDAPMIDAPMVDAPPPTSNETCAAAPTLASASVASPLATYTSRVTAAFGAANDYNPLNTSGLPPACAFAYDARGREVVYAITLAPGERLRLRAELADGKQAGIYLLDTCPGASWPDFDMTGACGSNEYAAGFCGPVGCDAATLNVLYPTMLAGQPTAPAVFWVVVDQVAGDTSPGFILDWQVLPPL